MFIWLHRFLKWLIFTYMCLSHEQVSCQVTNVLHLSSQRRLQRNSWRTEEKRPRYLLKFLTFFLGSKNFLRLGKFFLNPKEIFMSPRQGVKNILVFSGCLISPMFSYCGLRWCRFANSRLGVRLLNLISHVFTASDYVRERPFNATLEAEVSSNFSFFLPFLCMRHPHLMSGLLGISALFELTLFCDTMWPFVVLGVCMCAGQRISLSALARDLLKGPNGEISRETGSGGGKEGSRESSRQQRAEEDDRLEIAVQGKDPSAEGGSDGRLSKMS